MTIVLYILLAILVADLLTGIFHWWEDRYGNPNWFILGKYVIEPNIRHHKEPMSFCKGNYWTRNWTTLVPTLLLSIGCYMVGYYFLSLVFICASQSNEIHCWEHTKTNKFIRFLQNYNILQNKKCHALHHKRPYDTNYCVMTMVVNPVLNKLNFWYYLEKLVFTIFRVKPRKEREIY